MEVEQIEIREHLGRHPPRARGHTRSTQNSARRLDDGTAAGYLTGSMAADLRDALEFISLVRARHQAATLETGEQPHNHVDPHSLSKLDRRTLKDAFRVLGNAQKLFKFRDRPASG